MTDTGKNSRKDIKRKPVEEDVVKDSSISSKRKKPRVETAASSQTDGKRKRNHREIQKNSTSRKKRKNLHTNSEVVTMDDNDLDEHTKLLTSVTGKMERLPLYNKEGQGKEEGEEEEEEEVGQKKEAAEEKGENKGVGKEAAAQYLVTWNSKRDKWTFKKKIQYWLLQNMFDKKKVSKAHFKVMLLYLDGLCGNQRGLARDRAEKVVSQNKSDKDEVSESKVKYKRACKVLMILSD